MALESHSLPFVHFQKLINCNAVYSKEIFRMVFINNAVLFGTIVALTLITATQENNNSERIINRNIDAVILQGSNGESYPTEESQCTVIDVDFTTQSTVFSSDNGIGCVSVDLLELDGGECMAFLNNIMADPDRSCPGEG